MLENFIYAKEKSLFEEALSNGEVLDEAIVFIEDTKEIWNHGTYFDGSTFDSSNIEASIQNIIDSYATKAEIPTKLSQLENDSDYITKTEVADNYQVKGNYVEEDVYDGVYAVDANGKLIDYNTADSSCLGVALVKGEHKFMIAKSAATNGTNTTLYWSKNLFQKDVAGITNISSGADYIGEGNKYGTDFTTWSTGPVVDFNGAANTAAIIAGYTEHGVSMDARDMCTVLNTFNASDSYNDWYVPACGQLALMYLAKTDINAALAKIGGTALEPYNYWSSSEFDADSAWYVNFFSGGVNEGSKSIGYRVRFIRDISTKSLKERVSEIEASVQTSLNNTDYYMGNNTTTSITSIPVNKRLVIANISSSQSFSLASTLPAGKEIYIIIYNSGSNAISIALPNTGNYKCLVDTALSIDAQNYAEINIISDGTNMYIRAL